MQFIIGWSFHKGAWRALRRGTANMDVLVSLGTSAAYAYSVASVIIHKVPCAMAVLCLVHARRPGAVGQGPAHLQ